MTRDHLIVLVSWSHVDLAFIELLRKKYKREVEIIRYAHHPSWNSSKRSYLKNILHLIKFFIRTTIFTRGRVKILFGHHLCRMFLITSIFSKKTYFIYNELPNLDRGSLTSIDRMIFRFAHNIYISSESRFKLLKRMGFKLHNCNILENITFAVPYPLKSAIRNGRAIFIGTISEKRFSGSAISALKETSKYVSAIHILPSFVDRSFDRNSLNVEWLEKVEHADINSLLSKYEYGILSYENDSLNNFYAAPLKIYEYVNMGLRVISLLPNAGIESIQTSYPELFVDLGLNSRAENFSWAGYQRARKSFLTNASITNAKFAKQVNRE